MKKNLVWFGVLYFIFGVFQVSNAQTRRSGLGPAVLHRNAIESVDSTSTLTTHASTIATAKTAETEPATISTKSHSVNTVFNAEGYTHVKVFCDMFNSSNPTATLVPYMYESSSAKFYASSGAMETVTTEEFYVIATDQTEYLFMYCTDLTGGIDVYLQGIIERGY